jgi:hypothetical protein
MGSPSRNAPFALSAASEAAAARPGQTPWIVAPLLLAAALAAVLAAAGIWHAGGIALSAPPTISATGNRFDPVRGESRRDGPAIVVEALDRTGVAVVSWRTAPFSAETYSRVEWRVGTATPRGVALTMLWGTREQPGRTLSKRIDWPGYGPAVIRLTAEDGWRGTIVGVALAVSGQLGQPLAVASASIAGDSVGASIGEVLRQWGQFFPFRGITITLPFDEERTHDLPPVVAIALAVGLASLAYAVLARRRGRALDARILWTLFVAGWLILDARWQATLGRQLVETARQFAGKTLDEKYRSVDDHELYALIGKVREALPPPPVRVLFLADNYALRTRGSYFFYPHNVYHPLRWGPKSVPGPDDLHPGDHVVLFLYTGARYDRAERALVWPDGRRREVDELLYQDVGPIVVRAR